MALEARALKELNSITLRRTDLVISKLSRAATIPNNSVALILDVEFS